MKKNKKLKLYNIDDLHKEYMKDPEYKKAYEEIQPEFEIIKAIIRARAKGDMTQREFAERIGMTQSSLARFEAGRANPTWSTIKRMVSGLGLKIVIM